MQSPTLLQTENKKDSKLAPSIKRKARVSDGDDISIDSGDEAREESHDTSDSNPDLKVRLMTVF
jgi:hypothetical protein